MIQSILPLVVVLAVLATALPLVAAEVTVFAAASLNDSMKEIAAAYEKRTGDTIRLNLGASSTLARQVREGARADVLFSADEAKMNELEAEGLVAKGSRRSRLSNSLVIVVAAEGGAAIGSPRDLATDRVKRLALAEPRIVPAGIYAKEYLQKQGLWKAVEAKVIPTENVRAALAAVEAGNVDAAIVYRTDATSSTKVKVAFTVPREEGPAIRYPMAVMRESKQPKAARAFLEHLAGDEAGQSFAKAGFILLESPGAP